MKRIISLILIANTYHTLLNMDLIKQMNPKKKIYNEETSVNPQTIVFKEILKAPTTAEMLLITNRAEKDHNITASNIAHFALMQEKNENIHKVVFLQMTRIAQYKKTIAKNNKLCPVLELHNNFNTILSLHKEYQEARLYAEAYGLSISKAQQYHATPYPIEVAPNIAFEEYIDLEIDLFQLSANQKLLNKIVAMLTTHIDKTPSSLVLLDNTYQ